MYICIIKKVYFLHYIISIINEQFKCNAYEY